MAQPEPEPEPQADPELGSENIDSFITKLNNGFCYVYNPIKKCTRYYIIVEEELLTFRWSEIESGILKANTKNALFSAAGGGEINWLNQSLIRESYLKSNDIKYKLPSTVDKYKVENPITFDFKLLTEETLIDHTREPTQYAWKMGMGCEDTAHNVAGQASGLAEAAGYDPVSSKIDHAVYVERKLPKDTTNYLTLTNYQLLNDPIFERDGGGGRPGDHPSDHSAIYFDIYLSGRDTGHKLFSWNAEGFCNVIPWFTNSDDFDKINDIINGDNINFGDVYKLCSLLNGSILSRWETRLGNKSIDMLKSEAPVVSRTSNDKPGGFSSLKQWMDYISLFKQNNCKILMIQELFLKDYLKGKTLEEARLFADKIANFIISLLRLNADEVWEYKWDTYTGMILWSPDYNEGVSVSIEREQSHISEEGGAAARRSTVAPDVVPRAEATGATDEALGEDFEEIDVAELGEGSGVYNSESPKYSTFISLQRGDKMLNLVNIHLKALTAKEGYVNGASDVYDLHIYELQNIMHHIPITSQQYYLIGDFNCEYVDQLMRNLFVEGCDSERRMRDTPSSWANLETLVGMTGKALGDAAAGARAAATAVADRAREAVPMGQNAFDIGSVAGMAGAALPTASDVAAAGARAAAAARRAGSFLRWPSNGGGKKHKSTRRKRKSTRKKHKKTHKKSNRRKSYKKKKKN